MKKFNKTKFTCVDFFNYKPDITYKQSAEDKEAIIDKSRIEFRKIAHPYI